MSPICYEFTIFVLTNMNLICLAGTLNPRAHYISSMGTNQPNSLRTAFERMIDLDTVAEALSEVQTFCVKASSFSSPLAQKMAVDGKTSPGMHSDDGNDRDDNGGCTSSLVTQGGGYECPLSPFTADQFTHCTQDPDHGASTSSRIPSSQANAPVDSSGSSSQWIDDVPVPDPYIYHIPDIHS
jgi:hypothetical protein